jgi:hypothetical protein
MFLHRKEYRAIIERINSLEQRVADLEQGPTVNTWSAGKVELKDVAAFMDKLAAQKPLSEEDRKALDSIKCFSQIGSEAHRNA